MKIYDIKDVREIGQQLLYFVHIPAEKYKSDTSHFPYIVSVLTILIKFSVSVRQGVLETREELPSRERY